MAATQETREVFSPVLINLGHHDHDAARVQRLQHVRALTTPHTR
jgi:prephenate dehydrogenase